MNKYKIGTWIYQNSGGSAIEQKLIKKLNDRDIEVVTNLNLTHAVVKSGSIICNGTNMEELDLFFSYNAGEISKYQVYLYEVVDYFTTCINSYKSYDISEDKLKTILLLNAANIPTTKFRLCNADEFEKLSDTFDDWGSFVYKPTISGFGGVGLFKIDTKSSFEAIKSFLHRTNLSDFYVEKYIKNDFTDYRVDIVDGKFVSCYGRKAPKYDWRTNISSGGSIFLREPNDEIVDLAIKATKVIGLDVAGVDIMYDLEREEYIVIEVNGIPAFATPEQEQMGLNFNDKKNDLIVDLIDKKLKKI